MADPSWIDRLLSTTRGRVLSLLRRRPSTVNELARALEVTDNAVRSHLSALERDGMVETVSVRREGVGKPARVYRLVPEAEEFFRKGYAPVLSAVLDELSDREGEEATERLLRDAGHRAGSGRSAPGGGSETSAAARIEAALDALADLGAAVEPERGEDGSVVLRGHGCPLSALVGRHPELCGLVESFLEEVTGAEVEERCVRDRDRPRCSFVIRPTETP